MHINRKSIKQVLREAKPMLGTVNFSNSPDQVEIAAVAGFDFIYIDTQHGGQGTDTMLHMVRAAQAFGILPVIRIEEITRPNIEHILDIGVAAVWVPDIKSADDVRRVVDYARFAPLGSRSGCWGVRSNAYGHFSVEEQVRHDNESIGIFCSVESPEALENLPEILSVEGIDGITIGRHDLSVRMGYPGGSNHPVVVSKTKEVAAMVRESGLCAGIFASDADEVRAFEGAIDYCALGIDNDMMLQMYRNLINEVRPPR